MFRPLMTGLETEVVWDYVQSPYLSYMGFPSGPTKNIPNIQTLSFTSYMTMKSQTSHITGLLPLSQVHFLQLPALALKDLHPLDHAWSRTL